MPGRRTRREEGRKGIVFWLLILVIGALIGSVVSEIIGLFFQDGTSPIHKFFIAGIRPGFGPRSFNWYVFDFTLEFHVKLNLCSLMGLIAAIYVGRLL